MKPVTLNPNNVYMSCNFNHSYSNHYDKYYH